MEVNPPMAGKDTTRDYMCNSFCLCATIRNSVPRKFILRNFTYFVLILSILQDLLMKMHTKFRRISLLNTLLRILLPIFLYNSCGMLPINTQYVKFRSIKFRANVQYAEYHNKKLLYTEAWA